MRFKINLTRTTRQKMLPMDYQYYLSAWIYKVLDKQTRNLLNFFMIMVMAMVTINYINCFVFHG